MIIYVISRHLPILTLRASDACGAFSRLLSDATIHHSLNPRRFVPHTGSRELAERYPRPPWSCAEAQIARTSVRTPS